MCYGERCSCYQNGFNDGHDDSTQEAENNVKPKYENINWDSVDALFTMMVKSSFVKSRVLNIAADHGFFITKNTNHNVAKELSIMVT